MSSRDPEGILGDVSSAPESADDLPEGWVATVLGAGLITDVQPGFACGTHNRDGEGVPHLRPMNVNEGGKIDLSDVKYVPKSQAERDERWIRTGDVLFNNTNSPELVGKTACYDLLEPRAFSNHMTRLRCRPDLLTPPFCALTLHQKWREGYFQSICNNHVSQASISRSVLLETTIRLPSLAEQKRIVAKVEELLGRVRAVRERLARATAILKRFRQSVLAAACSGRLTATWRAEAFGIDDAADIISRLEEAHTAAGGHKRGNAAAPTDEAHDLKENELPLTWRMTELRTAVCPDRPITYGILKPGPDTSSGIPYVRVADFPNDRLNLEGLRRTTCEIESSYSRARLRTGDILLSIRGTVGRVCDVPAQLENANITQDTARLSIQPALSTAYVMWFLRAAPTQKRMQKAIKGVAVRGINIGDVRAIQLPVPPFCEQLEIVRRVEALFALADKIEARVQAASARVEKLTQAILAKAFRGELVPHRG